MPAPKELDPTAGPTARFGVELRKYRYAAKLTQAQLARNVRQELVSTVPQGREDGRKAERPMVSTTNGVTAQPARTDVMANRTRTVRPCR